MTATVALGYDLALALDEESYHLERDAEGRAYGFAMTDENAAALETCIQREMPRGGAIAGVAVEPTHLRLRVDPTATGQPDPVTEYTTVLGDAVGRFNSEHASPFEEVVPGERFVGVYRPEDAPDREAWIERNTDDDRLPEADGPVADLAPYDDAHLMPDRHLAYRVAVLVDAESYERGELSGYAHAEAADPFEWDAEAVETVEQLEGDRQGWPDGTLSVEVHPGYAVAEIHNGAFNAPPDAYADAVRRELERYNREKGERGVRGGAVPRPALAVRESPAYVEAVETDALDEWLADLPDLDGDPVEPAPDDEPEESGGRLSRLSPFGGGNE
jgi:hypothetical protein